ncbi:hypothetical protein DERP_002080 [Dermatophagoides pteronyssinus]|uniref:Uncharacterized protein n=1 Tax=Dermatophagoides pteronyssinus TaxID=6956 RepID=A0ABQ8JGP8_DERPT|nr:hypothetical protein DERP_002080 [Dermatophagoides pteronyssinus]
MYYELILSSQLKLLYNNKDDDDNNSYVVTKLVISQLPDVKENSVEIYFGFKQLSIVFALIDRLIDDVPRFLN